MHSGVTPLLVIIPSIPAAPQGNALFLDQKAVSGLGLYCRFWTGRVRCIFREGPATAILFGSKHEPQSLPFEVAVIPADAPVPNALLHDAAVVLGSGDNHLDLPLAAQCRALGVPLAFVIENILETRLQIIALSDAPVMQRLKSLVWTLQSELKRLRAFKEASALQANGVPSARRYARVNSETLAYFDTRLSRDMLATEADVAAKAERLAAGGPLRLVFSGRLERLKGADHLVPIAQHLSKRGVNYRFDVFGAGSLAKSIREAAAAAQLAQRFFVHTPLDFETQLAPWMRTCADLFICCHRQSDPSCTYLETLGCGVPIIGYENRAWRGIIDLADVGWVVPMNADDVARKVIQLDARRSEISDKMQKALAFAKAHCFETEFKSRVDQLWRLARAS